MASCRPFLCDSSGPKSSKTGTSLFSVGLWSYSVFAVVMMLGCIVATSVLYDQDDGHHGLPPSISSTWVPAPGNYISRWFMGVGFGMLGVMTISVYAGEKKVQNPSIKSEWILGVALLGVFFLSWVPAICDAQNNPTCEGNNNVHLFCAACGFIFFDISMILTVYNRHKRSPKNPVLEWVLAIIALCFAIALALDGIYDYFHGAVYLIEWTNVAIMTGCLLAIVRGTPAIEHLGVGAIKISEVGQGDLGTGFFPIPRGTGVSLLTGFSARLGTKICAGFYFGTLVVSIFIGLHRGYLPATKGQFWMISDMWASKPGNMLSRWAVIQGAHFGFMTQLCLFFSTDEKRRKLLLVISELALVGLSIVGICNEKENIDLHRFGAVVFFFGYDLYIAGTLFEKKMRKVRFPVGVTKLLAHVLRLAIHHGLFDHLDIAYWNRHSENLEAALQWLDALAIIVYMIADVWSHPENKAISVGVMQMSSGSENDASNEMVEAKPSGGDWIGV